MPTKSCSSSDLVWIRTTRAISCRGSIHDFTERTISTLTGEFMYVFTPRVAGISLYIKLILRQRLVVISFHEQDGDRDGEDA